MNATFPSPYRFIPISAWVHVPDWAKQVSIDHPFADGLSGWLDLDIEAKTKILVGAEPRTEGNHNHVRFFTLPDGRRAIPGSGLRGAIRSIIEIAAFGKAEFVDEQQYGIRDLTRGANPIYAKWLVDSNIPRGPSKLPRTRPLSRAGWLRRVRDESTLEERWLLRPCDFARVSVSELEKLKAGIATALEPREGARERRSHWGPETSANLDVMPKRFVARAYWRNKGPNGKPQGPYVPHVEVEYAEAVVPSGGTGVAGIIVFTGKPAEGVHQLPANPNYHKHYYGKKKHEFFFYNDATFEIDVTHLRKDFLTVHGEAPGREATESWKGWQTDFAAGSPIPAFYLAPSVNPTAKPSKPEEIVAIGLAMMFRLAHRAKTHDLLANASPRHREADVLDIPTLLFGRLPDATRNMRGLKGRVAFEPAVAEDTPEELTRGPTVLGSPKAQFYPAYVKQPRSVPQNQKRAYASYTPDEKAAEPLIRRPELAGRKRYPVRGTAQVPGPGQAGEEMQLTLHPLAAGTCFKGRVRFHNLKPEELGALVFGLRLWSPDWGERPDLRHALGMAKPYGLGAVDITISGGLIEENRLDAEGKRVMKEIDAAAADGLVGPFVAHMHEALRKEQELRSKAGGPQPVPVTWEASEQVEYLLAMADPSKATADLAYPVLSLEGESRNDFKQAKEDGAVLALYPRRAASAEAGAKPGTVTDEQAFPRTGPGGAGGTGGGAPPGGSQKRGAKGGPGATSPPPGALSPGTQMRDVESGEIVVVLGPGARPDRVRVRFENGDEDEVRPAALAKP
jgi:CRISPR-associated protein (TIGR03986 family)